MESKSAAGERFAGDNQILPEESVVRSFAAGPGRGRVC
jgi:hypothetical protein